MEALIYVIICSIIYQLWKKFKTNSRKNLLFGDIIYYNDIGQLEKSIYFIFLKGYVKE